MRSGAASLAAPFFVGSRKVTLQLISGLDQLVFIED